MKLVVKICFVFVIIWGFSQLTHAQDKSQEIDLLVQKLVDRGQFNGVVLVEHEGKVIYRNATGFANFEQKRELQIDTSFDTASISKTFTAMSVMILAERGKLKYEDALTKYFPELPYQGITIRHLLTHTSGLPEYFDVYFNKFKQWDKSKILKNADLIDLFQTEKPAVRFAPGEKFEYSNTAFCFLASIVEKVSGQKFEQLLQDNIFKPLEMNNTRIVSKLSNDPPNFARQYLQPELLSAKFVSPDNLPNTYFVITFGGLVGDGSVSSTVEDLYKWGKSFDTEKLVSKKTIEEAWTKGILKDGSEAKTYVGSRGFDSGYGYGWFIRDGANGSKVYWHTGGWAGYVNYFQRNPKLKQTIILLSNASNSAVSRLALAIERILSSQPYEIPKTPIANALVKTMLKEGGEASVKLYRDLKTTKSNEYIFSQGQLNALGYELLGQKKFKDAITIFKLNVEEYPREGDVYDSLGEAYMLSGDNDLAIKNYEKSLELTPQNQNAAEMLKKLKQP